MKFVQRNKNIVQVWSCEYDFIHSCSFVLQNGAIFLLLIDFDIVSVECHCILIAHM